MLFGDFASMPVLSTTLENKNRNTHSKFMLNMLRSLSEIKSSTIT